MPHPPLIAWQQFFNIIGTAAATLVGLMFVAASVGTGVFTPERQAGLRSFLSPTVFAFTSVLAASLLGVVPAASPRVPGVLCAGLGLIGAAYSATVWRRMVQAGIHRAIDAEDRTMYAAVPAFAYLVLVAAGAGFVCRSDAAPAVMASGMGILLLADIRNAWDMTTWVLLRKGREAGQVSADPPNLQPDD